MNCAEWEERVALYLGVAWIGLLTVAYQLSGVRQRMALANASPLP